MILPMLHFNMENLIVLGLKACIYGYEKGGSIGVFCLSKGYSDFLILVCFLHLAFQHLLEPQKQKGKQK